jgi:hypothetical protein
MNWNIVLAALIAILTLSGAGLAGQLAATKPWHKWFFWGTGLVAVILIGVQTTLNEHSQDHLQHQLDAIQKNTETPPQVTLNPNIQIMPRPEEQHTHVQFVNPSQAPGNSSPPFKEGESSKINIGFSNFGDYLATNCVESGAIYFEKLPVNENKLFQKFLGQTTPQNCGDMMPRSGESYQYTYRSYWTPKLSGTDILQLDQGEALICGTARTTWSDKTGRYQMDFCSCLTSNYPAEKSLAWHSCKVHNDETRLQ